MLARTYRVVLRQTRDFEFHVVAEDSDDAVEKACEQGLDRHGSWLWPRYC